MLHAKLLDNDNRLQQQAIGILGVNMIHACFRYHKNPDDLLLALMDNLRGRVAIDMIRISGPDFEQVDNRLLCLKLVEHNMTDVAIFGPDGRALHGSEFLYRKNVLVVRGSFRPMTLVNQDMIRTSFEQFRNEPDIDASKTSMLCEITLDNLKADGDLSDRDFLDRAETLCAMGQTVMITNCEQHQKLIAYLEDFKVQKLGMVIGVNPLLELLTNKYYKNMDGSLLTAFGELFIKNVRFYVYPCQHEDSDELLSAANLPLPDAIKFLYQHLIDSRHIVDIQGFRNDILNIYSKKVLQMLQADTEGWEAMVPAKIATLIKEKCLFGYPCQRLVFEY